MADVAATSTAAPATSTPTPNTYTNQTASTSAAMDQLLLDKMAFDLKTQQISASLSSSAAVTNLITSAHQAAGNAAKSVGQNMVDSSRR